jgi:2-oxoglutarate ferredoxin oxidoreductase subunit beta
MTSSEKTENLVDEKAKAEASLISIEQPEHPLAQQTMSGKVLGSPYNAFCSGCGYGAVAMAITYVISKDQARIKNYPFVVGIGCYTAMSLLLPGRQSLTTLHGRTLPVATGIKLSAPELKPIVITGDGDCLAIGAGHFVNACRRNIDVVVIMLHNNVYGMTGGQLAPTIDLGNKATTAPYGCIEEPFDAVELAMASGATHVARWTVLSMRGFIRSLEKALIHKGLSFIEIISPCPTNYGRRNGFPEPRDLLRSIRDNTVYIKDAASMSSHERKGKYIIGEFRKIIRSELSDEYRKLAELAGGKSDETGDTDSRFRRPGHHHPEYADRHGNKSLHR